IEGQRGPVLRVPEDAGEDLGEIGLALGNEDRGWLAHEITRGRKRATGKRRRSAAEKLEDARRWGIAPRRGSAGAGGRWGEPARIYGAGGQARNPTPQVDPLR